MRSSRSEAQVRIRVKRNPRPFFKKLILLAIALYVVFVLFSFVQGHLVSRLAKVELIKEGVVQDSIPVHGTIVRNEDVVNSPRSGKLKIILPEGERVRVGQVIAQVIVPSLDNSSGETTYNISAPKAGLISYHIDGLEKIYSLDNIKDLDFEKIKTIESVPKVFSGGANVEEGKPVAKIINNLDPLDIICRLGENAKNFAKTDKNQFNVYFESSTKELYMTKLEEKNFRGQQNLILLSMNHYNKELITSRNINLNIITERYEGYYIPKDVLVTKDGVNGIYTVYKEKAKWKEIEIKGEAGGNVVVSGVTPDLRVIMNPQLVKEGYPVTIP